MLIVGTIRKKEELCALGEGVTVVPMGASAFDKERLTRARIVPRVVVDAHDEAKRILENAEKEADQLRQGLAARLAEERAVVLEVTKQEELAKLAGLRLAIEHEVRKVPEEIAERATAATLLVLERLLRQDVAADEDRARSLFHTALEEVRSARSLSVECTREDQGALCAALREHFGLESDSIEIKTNETLARGDLLLHLGTGSIDARIAARIDRLAPVVLDALYGK